MTVPATVRKATLTGNGSNTSFPFTFKVFATADVEVTTADADGVETVRVLDSDYSVSLNSDQDADPGGEITYPLSGSALATGETLVVIGDLEYGQETAIPTGGDFDPGVMEDALDRLTMQVQQLKEQLSRSVKVPVTSSTDPDDLVDELVTAGAGAENAWDAFRSQYYGSATSDPTADPLGNAPTAGGLYYNSLNTMMRIHNGTTWQDAATTVSTPYQIFSGNGVLTDFTLSSAPGSLGSLEAFISGVRQRPTIDYTLSGVTVTFTSAPPSASNNVFFCWIATTGIGVPSDETVTLAKMATSAYGTSGANKLLQLDATGKLPAVDGSQLTNIIGQQSGEICYFARNTPPTGFLKADGSTISRTTYAALFAAIGTTFGAGDGSTTFKLPDLRGEFVRGWDDARGVDSGRVFGSTQTEMIGPHTHPTGQYGSLGSGIGGSKYIVGSGGDIPANSGTENRPRNVALLACIKT